MSQIWTAEIRTDRGKGASRRLRRADKVPAVIYGAGKDAISISLAANFVKKQLENEAIFNTVLTVEVAGGKDETCVIKDLQRHPSTGAAFHIDLQRSGKNTLVKHIPVLLTGQEEAPGVKAGGLLSLLQSSIEVSCVAKNLPTVLSIDVATMEEGSSLRLSQLEMPKGVRITALSHGNSDYDQAVVNIGKVKKH